MFRSSTLGVRLTFILGLVLSLFVGLLVYALTVNHRNELLRETTFSTHRLAETVVRSIGYSMLNHTEREIPETLRAIGRDRGVDRIRIINGRGMVAYSSDETEVGTTLARDSEVCRQCHPGGTPLESLQPLEGSRVYHNMDGGRLLSVLDIIHNQDACSNAACHAHPADQKVLGILDIAVSLEEMDHRSAISTRRLIVAASLSILGICILAGLVIHRFVGKPIKGLLEGVCGVAAGDFDHHVPVASHDEIGRLTKAYNDMTDRLRFHIRKLTDTQEQLFHAEKLACLGKMAAGVAHELNSPLTVILNDSSLLLRDAQPGSKEEDDLRVIVSEARRCGEIIHDLLDFTRFEKPEKKPADLNEVVHDTLELIKRQSMLHNIDVTLDLAPDLPSVRIDTNQIKQVFLDIMTNAVHAMPDGGQLIIESRFAPMDQLVVVAFTDTGTGIPKQNIEQIFKPFFTTKDATCGTGLGLAICYEILQKHGGSIAVQSTVGKGSVFSVQIPISNGNR